MKLKNFLAAMLLMAAMSGCKRDAPDRTDRSDGEILSEVKSWYSSEIQGIQKKDPLFKVPDRARPIWDSTKVIRDNGSIKVIVKTSGYHIVNPEIAGSSTLVFYTSNNKTDSAELVELLCKKEYLTGKAYSSNTDYAKGNLNGLSYGSFFVSALNNKIKKTFHYEAGSLINDLHSYVKVSRPDDHGVFSLNGKKVAYNKKIIQGTKRSSEWENCDTVWFIVYDPHTGMIITMDFMGYTCENDGSDIPDDDGYPDDDGPEHQEPPLTPEQKKDPCVEKAKINQRSYNANIAKKNLDLYNSEKTHEYGVEQNLTSLTTDSYKDIALRQGGSDYFETDFSWNSTEGYTVGWSHSHPENGGPSPEDVFAMLAHLSDPELQNSGANSVNFYKDNVSITVVTEDGNVTVTVKDWDKLKDVYDRYINDPGGFDDEYRDFSDSFKSTYTFQSHTNSDIHALNTLFGSSINVYKSGVKSPYFNPIKEGAVGPQTLQCP
jgi:hypothetical protein